MAGKKILKEQAKTQWERFDVECLINRILTAEMEEIEWPANKVPKFLKKENNKNHQNGLWLQN